MPWWSLRGRLASEHWHFFGTRLGPLPRRRPDASGGLTSLGLEGEQLGVEPTGGQQSFMRAGFADPRPRRDPFTDLMGVTGNTITMLTLVMVALCWPYAWGPVLAITRAERARS